MLRLQRSTDLARNIVKSVRQNPVPMLALVSIAIVQIGAGLDATIDEVARSPAGAFVQAVIVTLAFGRVSGDALHRYRHAGAADRVLRQIAQRLVAGESLHCEVLRRAFLELDLVRELCAGRWSAVAETSPAGCGVFLLGYQYFGHHLKIPSMEASRLTEIAARASESASYRHLLLVDGFRQLLSGDDLERMADDVERRAVARLPVNSRSAEADLRLEARLNAATDDSLLIVSTTSQTSGFGRDFVSRHEGRLRELRVVHLSPRIHSHPALLAELAQLDVPAVVIPIGQQIPDSVADAVRRVVRILIGSSVMWESFGSTRIHLDTRVMTDAHPGIRVRMLSSLNYLQLFPGNLSYAANLYRFGYEISDAELIARISGPLNSWIASHAIPYEGEAGCDELARRSIAELGRWLTGVPDSVVRVSRFYPQLKAMLPEDRSRAALQAVMDVLAAGLEATQSADSDVAEREHRIHVPLAGGNHDEPRVILTGNRTAHVSVGVVLHRAGRIMVVRKSTAPNVGRWSIPAGHCVWGESAHLAAGRELLEEVGIASDSLELAFSGEIDEGVPCRYGQSIHLWFLYRLDLKSDPPIHLDESELREFKWIDAGLLPKLRRKTPAFALLSQVAMPAFVSPTDAVAAPPAGRSPGRRA